MFGTEPLPPDHPLRTPANVVPTPHLGHVADRTFEMFFGDAVAAITEWIDQKD